MVLVVGCFQPVVPTGIPCSMSGDCPVGQMCDRVRNLCGVPPIDASPGDGADAPVDALGDAMLIDAPDLGPWGAVLPITEVNSPSNDTDPAISSDGRELFFTSSRPGGAGGQDLYLARRTNAILPFNAPTLVSELSTAQNETGPYLTPDHLTIYFQRGGEIFRSSRPNRGSAFAAPLVDPGLSSAMQDVNPSLSHDGLTASVTREIAAGDRDLYLFTRATLASPWSAGVLTTLLQSPTIDSGAEFTADPLELYFHSDRAGAPGTDLFRATRASTSAPFGSPTNVTELNTAMLESDPTITADRRLIVFERQQDLVYSVR